MNDIAEPFDCDQQGEGHEHARNDTCDAAKNCLHVELSELLHRLARIHSGQPDFSVDSEYRIDFELQYS